MSVPTLVIGGTPVPAPAISCCKYLDNVFVAASSAPEDEDSVLCTVQKENVALPKFRFMAKSGYVRKFCSSVKLDSAVSVRLVFPSWVLLEDFAMVRQSLEGTEDSRLDSPGMPPALSQGRAEPGNVLARAPPRRLPPDGGAGHRLYIHRPASHLVQI